MKKTTSKRRDRYWAIVGGITIGPFLSYGGARRAAESRAISAANDVASLAPIDIADAPDYCVRADGIIRRDNGTSRATMLVLVEYRPNKRTVTVYGEPWRKED